MRRSRHLAISVTRRGLGGDEGYELIKGFMCWQGFEMYGSFWNDQPPFHTGLLHALFTSFGPSVFAAWLLSVAFAALLLVSLGEIIRRQFGLLAGLMALVLLIGSPYAANAPSHSGRTGDRDGGAGA